MSASSWKPATEVKKRRGVVLNNAANIVSVACGRNLVRKLRPSALIVSVLMIGVTVPAQTAVAADQSQLTWEPCAEQPTLECSALDVPLDYRSPRGQTIEIAISRLASADPRKRRGVLLTNPGGPGGPGLTFPSTLVGAGLPRGVRDAYDIIGFDPRGVGRSTPVSCGLTPEQQGRGTIPRWADEPADVTAWAAEAKAIARQCTASETAWMLPYVTTANTARDMDRIRIALGEPKLSYLGYSYGTHLGSVYTTMFPQRSDRIVIDSSLAPGGLHVEGTRLMARGLQDRFPDFARWLAARDDEYGMGATQRQVTARYFALAEKLDAKPLPGLDGTTFRAANIGATYRDSRFPVLAELWQAAAGDEPLPEGPTDPSADNVISSYFHVICGDASWPRSVRAYQHDVEVDRMRYPMIGAATAGIRPCAFWPDPVEPPVQVKGRGPSNVLMVQNTRDPGTPLVGAQKLRRAFGERARMVTVDAGGHGSYLFIGNGCADDAVTAYLTEGSRPARDMTCAAEPTTAVSADNEAIIGGVL